MLSPRVSLQDAYWLLCRRLRAASADRDRRALSNGSTPGSPTQAAAEGAGGILFGHSRTIIDSTFGDLTAWQPLLYRSAENLADLLSGQQRSGRPAM